MPQLYAVVDGTGTYRDGDLFLQPGATPVTDEQADRIRRSGIEWVYVQEGREAGKPLPPIEPEPEPEPYGKFQGRDGKWYFHAPVAGGSRVEQSKPFDTEDEVDEAIEEAVNEKPLIPLAGEVQGGEGGTFTSEDSGLAKAVKCRAVRCEEEFTDTGARTNHERVKHPELFKVT